MSWETTYRAVSGLFGPFANMILHKRIRAGKEDPKRILERKGQASLARPKGPLIWMHGASVGETSMLCLLYTSTLPTTSRV